MSTGYIYININAHMPGLVKIGFTDRSPSQRARELSQPTGVPGSYKVFKYWEVQNAASVEKRIFSALSARRATGEFFCYDNAAQCVLDVEKLLKEWGEIDSEGLSIPQRVRVEKAKEAAEKERLENQEKLNAIHEWRRMERKIKEEEEQRAEARSSFKIYQIQAAYKREKERKKNIMDSIPDEYHWMVYVSILASSLFFYGMPIILAIIYWFSISGESTDMKFAKERESSIFKNRDDAVRQRREAFFRSKGFAVSAQSGDEYVLYKIKT